ncbi:MAG TPA: hypothetical protein VKV33_06520 [Streptosporangiaceae bacterium]|nr:hypothetical protein [Streptosporangiaceae bacterium]
MAGLVWVADGCGAALVGAGSVVAGAAPATCELAASGTGAEWPSCADPAAGRVLWARFASGCAATSCDVSPVLGRPVDPPGMAAAAWAL